MILDLQSFGIGVGLVVSGWAAGMVVAYVFSMVKGIGRLGNGNS